MPPEPAFRKATAFEGFFNRMFGVLVGLGLGMRHNYLVDGKAGKFIPRRLILWNCAASGSWWRLAGKPSAYAMPKWRARSG
jgi:hypothetical protein